MKFEKRLLLSLTTMAFAVTAQASSWLIPNASMKKQINSPTQFSSSYNYRYSSLPKEGSVPNENIPWGDSYWPKNRAGASYRWMEHSNENARQDITPDYARTMFFSYHLPTTSELLNMSQEELAKLSPAEKYDIYLGNKDYKITKRYRGDNRLMKRTVNQPEDAYWEGYCYAWTAVSLNYGEPAPVVKTVYVDGHAIQLPFGSGDVKALLAMNYAEQLPGNPQMGRFCTNTLTFPSTKVLNGKEVFTLYGDTDGMLVSEYPEYLRKFQQTAARLGYKVTGKNGPNPYSPTFVEDELRLFNTPDCQDMNAGAFHVMMANQLGILKKGFAVDKTMDNEIWNQPVFKFKSQEVGPVALSRTAAPGAVSAIQMKTTIFYADDTDYGWAFWNPTLTNLFNPEKSFMDEYDRYNRALIKNGDEEKPLKYPEGIIDTAHYTYNVEIDASGNIVGGEWVSFDRPDVAWMPKREAFDGIYKRLGEIYEPIKIPAGAVPSYGDEE